MQSGYVFRMNISINSTNSLKPSGYYKYHVRYNVPHRVYFCVSYGS
jgi:hypothetical protein